MPKKHGQNRGFAFAEFKGDGDVLSVLQLNGKLSVGGRTLRVNEAQPLDDTQMEARHNSRPTPELSARVYLGNLPYDCEIIDIQSLLAQNDLTAIDIFPVHDRKTQRFTGISFVEFSSLDDASRAIGALDCASFSGRKLIAKPAEAKQSFRHIKD